MTDAPELASDIELDAYVDDQLDAARRIEVEAFLSGRPEIAARIMADLRLRDELRLALSGSRGMARPSTTDAARRLQGGLQRGRVLRLFQRAAAIGLFIGAGWFAHAGFGPLSVGEVIASTPPPAYVEDAIRAHATTLVRAGMRSLPATATYDAAEIRAATGIVMPDVPDGWQIRDVQLYPSQFGPSVELAIDAGELGSLSLFAERPGVFNVVPVTQSATAEADAAYWQIGDVAYALVGASGSTNLDRAAVRLADTLY